MNEKKARETRSWATAFGIVLVGLPILGAVASDGFTTVGLAMLLIGCALLVVGAIRERGQSSSS